MQAKRLTNIITRTLYPVLLLSSCQLAAENQDTDYFALSLEELANVKVITSSRREQTVKDSYANISVVTQSMIKTRGYRNIIEILEDIPGFDFATYEDGGGEYPVHFLNRGIGGDNGNTRLLIMVDGLVQNHISFNWAQGLTDEQILQDIERIEVVQGPGSSLYGAQAVSGIIHIITRKNVEGTELSLLLGEHGTSTLSLLHGGKIGSLNYQLALKSHQSDGDFGLDRPDPANYFHNNYYPDILTQDYDAQGNYLTNTPNPRAGERIPDGFNNSKNDTAFRLRIFKDKMQMGINYWNKNDGLGSYVVGYEYDATANDFMTHHSALTLFVKNEFELIENRLDWKSDLWYRTDTQESDTGFRYNYRFPDLKKSYHSGSSQIGFENQFDWRLDGNKTVILGVRMLGNRQTEQVVSLGRLQSGNASTTDSSWDIANAGDGLYQSNVNEIFDESELAFYALLEGDINETLSYSIGTRFSDGSDYGSANNPRAGLIYRPNNQWTIKTLYGSAFRQPSLFELRDEFRGSIDLTPEEIDTFEVEINHELSAKSKLKLNVFYSKLSDSISLVADPDRAGGERYANIDSSKVRGLSTHFDFQPIENITVYANYFFQQGTGETDNWGALSHTAEHKINAGVNWQTFENKLNVNLRTNHVGDRKTPASNTYFDGEAEGYTKFDLVLTWSGLFDIKNLDSQLLVNNLFDESYFGVGRQSGSSDREEYDPLTNPDPQGFIPAYHPQPGRTIYWTVNYKL